jgi:DNA-binding transcriptional LysR family regulator
VPFEKNGRGIEATPAARHLCEAGAETLPGPERLERTVEDLRQGRVEQIAVARFTFLAQAWMPHGVTALRARSPEVVEISSSELHPTGGRRAPDVDVRNESTDGPTGRIITRACHAAGFGPRHIARLDDHHAATGLAAAGLGITVLPRIAPAGLPGNLTTRPLAEPTAHRRIVAHTRNHPTRARPIHTTLTALREAAQRIPPSTPDEP